MAIRNKFRERFMERQEKNRSETEDLFLDILTGIGEDINRAMLILDSATDDSDAGEKIKEAYEILDGLQEELY